MDIKEYISSGIIERYVLGIATGEEAADVQRNMEAYADVRLAVEEFSIAYERQILAGAITPPDFVKERLKQTLQSDFAPAGQAGASEEAVVRPLWQEYRSVAAAVVAVIGLAASVFFYNRSATFEKMYHALLDEKLLLADNASLLNERVDLLSEQLRMVSSPETEAILLKGVKGKESSLARVYWNRQNNEVYLTEIRLDAPAADKQYQLWAIVDGNPVDAGLLEDCQQNLCKMKNITGAQAFAITLEKKGGSPAPDLTALTVMGEV